jgi:putative glutamine amidotransferase
LSAVPPLIGIPVLKSKTHSPPHVTVYAVPPSYSEAIAASGAAPLQIPQGLTLDTLRSIFDRLDGVLLAGGGDIDPAYYDQVAGDSISGLDRDRDEMEVALTRWAVDENKPILTICRGIQVMNVALGGTLYQDVLADMPGAIRHAYFQSQGFARDYRPHHVELSAGSHMARLMGGERFPVNSLHHQGINQVAPDLKPVAFAPDGLVEGVEVEGHPFAVGVQWHPESLVPEDAVMRSLFDGFVAAARR